MEGSGGHAHGHEAAHDGKGAHGPADAHGKAHGASRDPSHDPRAPHARSLRGHAASRPEPSAPLSGGERRTMAILVLGMLVSLAAIPILAVMTFSPTGNVFLALSPLLLTLVLCMALVSGHYKPSLLWAALALAHLLGMGALTFLNLTLPSPLNVPQAVTLSLLFAAVWVLLAWLSEGGPGPSAPARASHARVPGPAFSLETLPQFLHSLEDKAKALNFSIGRVYRSSNGGSAHMRERLRIPREWYNEFESVQEHERERRAQDLVRKIHGRLLEYARKEKQVFSADELSGLKNLVRSSHGESTVLEVLSANDSDPVQTYYAAAVEFCEQALQGLERQGHGGTLAREWRPDPHASPADRGGDDRRPGHGGHPGHDDRADHGGDGGDEESVYDSQGIRTANHGG